MKSVFVDSGFWIGLRSKNDEHHLDCQKVARWVMNQKVQMVVTPFIFAEVHARFSRIPPLRTQVTRDIWENPIVSIEQVSYKDQQQALALLKRFTDKEYSFADAVSFVVIERLKLSSAISFDDHFRQSGKVEVIDGSNL